MFTQVTAALNEECEDVNIDGVPQSAVARRLRKLGLLKKRAGSTRRSKVSCFIFLT